MPYEAFDINKIAAMYQPQGVSTDSLTTAFYMDLLFKRAITAIKFDGIPKEWNKPYFLYTLFARGYIAVVHTDKYGIVCQQCTLSGYSIYNVPTRAIVGSAVMQSEVPGIAAPKIIGKECAVIKLMPDYGSIIGIVRYFADRLSLASQAWSMNTINSKLAYLAEADTEAQANTIKTVFDEIQKGKPAVVWKGKKKAEDVPGQDKRPWEVAFNNLRANYIAPEIRADMRDIMSEFDSFMGIPSVPIRKKERLITSEAESNDVETRLLLDCMTDELNRTMETANEMYGLELSARPRYDKEGRENNAD